jgi:hypothetical protein
MQKFFYATLKEFGVGEHQQAGHALNDGQS